MPAYGIVMVGAGLYAMSLQVGLVSATASLFVVVLVGVGMTLSAVRVARNRIEKQLSQLVRAHHEERRLEIHPGLVVAMTELPLSEQIQLAKNIILQNAGPDADVSSLVAGATEILSSGNIGEAERIASLVPVLAARGRRRS